MQLPANVINTTTETSQANDLTLGWQNLNLLSHPNATLAPQARQVRASIGKNLNYVTLAPQARASGENLNYSLSRESDILVRSLVS